MGLLLLFKVKSKVLLFKINTGKDKIKLTYTSYAELYNNEIF